VDRIYLVREPVNVFSFYKPIFFSSQPHLKRDRSFKNCSYELQLMWNLNTDYIYSVG